MVPRWQKEDDTLEEVKIGEGDENKECLGSLSGRKMEEPGKATPCGGLKASLRILNFIVHFR